MEPGLSKRFWEWHGHSRDEDEDEYDNCELRTINLQEYPEAL
jgi:hypothetical protein